MPLPNPFDDVDPAAEDRAAEELAEIWRDAELPDAEERKALAAGAVSLAEGALAAGVAAGGAAAFAALTDGGVDVETLAYGFAVAAFSAVVTYVRVAWKRSRG